jgi:hypothetical protein
MLRADVQKIIENADSPEDASRLVCWLFEEEVGLSGNGWFDDDPVMEELLSNSYEAMSSRFKGFGAAAAS